MATIYNKKGGQFLNPEMIGDDNFFLHLTKQDVVRLRSLVGRGAQSIETPQSVDDWDLPELQTKAFGELLVCLLSDAKHHDQSKPMCEKVALWSER